MLRFELLYRRTGTLAPFLTVERECNGVRLRPGAADEVQGFANSSARGDDVVDDDHASAQGAARHRAPVAVLRGFRPVEGIRHVATVMFGERDGRGGHERNALVGGPE